MRSTIVICTLLICWVMIKNQLPSIYIVILLLIYAGILDIMEISNKKK